MTPLALSVACRASDRTRALFDGSIAIEGCAATFVDLDPEEAFFRAFRHAEFDVSELSLSSTMMAIDRGTCPYVPIPAFVSRVFRHSAIYIRTDRGIAAPGDLKGRLVGIPEYQVTAAVWVRGILEDEYGVKPSDLRWRSGGMEEPGRHEKLRFTPPAGVEIEPIAPGRTLAAMLAAGEIDALVAPRPPSCFRDGAPGVGRLFADFRSVERAWFARTGIFPIMHVIGVRKTLVERHPWLPASVYKAFLRAKQACIPKLFDLNALHVSLPWVAAEAEATRAAMGADFWPYGVDASRATLDAVARYSHAQGLTSRVLAPQDIFAASTIETVKI